MTTQYPPGTGQQWTPTHAPASSRKRSSVVPVLAGAAVAAVILGVAGFVFWPEGSSSAGGPGTGTGTAQSPPVQQTSPTTPATTPPATPTSTPGGTVAPLPPGFVRGTGPGYTIGVPRGWRRSVQGNSVVWTDPASSAYVQVDQTVWSGDPYEHWVTWEQEARADGKLKDFQRIGRSPARPSPDGRRPTSSSPGPAGRAPRAPATAASSPVAGRTPSWWRFPPPSGTGTRHS